MFGHCRVTINRHGAGQIHHAMKAIGNSKSAGHQGGPSARDADGSKGPAYDAQTVYKQWGFNLSDIGIHIEVFHGASDKFVPPKFSEYLAKNAKNVRLNLLEGQGHFCHVAYGYQMLKKVADLFYGQKDHRVQSEP